MSLFKSSDMLVEKMQSESENDIHIYRFTPSVFRLVPEQLKKHFSNKDKRLLLFRFIKGYWIYYLAVGDEICAYNCIKKNYLNRYRFMKKRDVATTPNFTFPDKRGKGYATLLFKSIMNDHAVNWKHWWALIFDWNSSSIAAAQNAGFRKIGYAKQGQFFISCIQEQTDLIVYRYDMNNV